MKTYFTTCLLFFLVNFSFGATITSVGDGSWEDPDSWDLARIPTNGDIIVIDDDNNIEVTTNNFTCNGAPATHIYVVGVLSFSNGAKLNLGCGSSLTVEDDGKIESGGGGSSKKIYICGVEVWNSGDGDVEGPVTFGVPLPIELTDFTAMVQSGHVFLEWTTNSEENNNYFEILRSRNGLSYEAIGQIDGAGTTNNQSRYSFDDTAPYEGVSYYKLKQTDFDGKSEMFSPIAVDLYTLEDGSCILTVYPNPCPVNCYAKLTECKLGEAQIQLMMTDATGHIVHEVYDTRNFDGSFDIKLDKTNNLKPGIYIVLAKTGKETFSEKVLLTE